MFTIVTLRQLLVRLSESIHSAEGKDGQYLSMSIVVNSVVKVIESHIKSLDSSNHERGKSTRTVTEFLTEFLANLAEDNDVLQKQYKPEITSMFYQENFFLMNERILKQWQSIMRHFISGDANNEVFDELLLKFNRVEGFFTSKKYEIYQKSLTFKRLAFLVYSSQGDQFDEAQLDALLKKMTEGFKN